MLLFKQLHLLDVDVEFNFITQKCTISVILQLQTYFHFYAAMTAVLVDLNWLL